MPTGPPRSAAASTPAASAPSFLRCTFSAAQVVGAVRNPQGLVEHEKYTQVRTGWNGAVMHARTFIADVFFSKAA